MSHRVREEGKTQSNSTVLIVVLAVVAVLLIIGAWIGVMWAVKRNRAQSSDNDGDRKDVQMQEKPPSDSRYEEGLFSSSSAEPAQTRYSQFDD